jgi:molybdopterin synthase catalytic subunit
MSAANSTIRERLATLEAEVRELGQFVRNDLTHRVARLEVGIYLLAVGIAGTFLAAVLDVLLRK